MSMNADNTKIDADYLNRATEGAHQNRQADAVITFKDAHGKPNSLQPQMGRVKCASAAFWVTMPLRRNCQVAKQPIGKPASRNKHPMRSPSPQRYKEEGQRSRLGKPSCAAAESSVNHIGNLSIPVMCSGANHNNHERILIASMCQF